jgi:four helix bundle protein
VNELEEDLKKRTKHFALDVIAFVRTLPVTEPAASISRQLLRSGTGVGANYRSTCRSRSKAEFVARIGVALEEADESRFWLEIIDESKLSGGTRARELLDEANQLCAILAASRITAAENLRRSGENPRRI